MSIIKKTCYYLLTFIVLIFMVYFLPGCSENNPFLNTGPAQSLITIQDFILDGDNATISFQHIAFGDIANSGSMLPWLSSGTTVILEQPKNLRIGDVAVYERDGDKIIHRIIGEKDDKWIFKGDNNDTTETVDKDCVIWRLCAVFY